ncbi:MAG TPA: glycosyltransferase family 4 protein, partial [Gemmataceae bacterium]|nr:glycosyltransferase family 4 protein [Gemmataceae bacterium]
RALLIAEACNPEWVSVPLVGWSLVRALADVCDAHVVTQVRNRDALVRAGWREGKEFTALDTEAVAGLAWQLGSWLRGGAGKGWTTLTALSALTYYHFESRVWDVFGSSIRKGAFDVVHRITPLSPTIPSPIATRCKTARVSFVLGPLNGGIAWPRGFERTRWQEGEWLSYLRDFYKLLPYYHSTRQHASAMLIGSRATWEQLPSRYRSRAFYLPENAIDPARFPAGQPRSPQHPLRALFVGRLVPYKGADMVLAASAGAIKAGKLNLTLVGDGPQRPFLVEEAQRLGIDSGVKFAGWLDHAAIRNHLEQSDIFVFPSVREFGGGAVLEAMAAGVPPIVVDYGGPAEIVTPTTGWVLPMGSRAEIIASLTSLLDALLARPEEITAKSRDAVRRCFAQFTWAAKAQRVLDIYSWVLGQSPNRPLFPQPIPDVSEKDSIGDYPGSDVHIEEAASVSYLSK